MTIYKCLFENKYQTSYAKVNDPNQLKEFIYNPKGELLTFDELKDLNDLEEYETDEYEDCETLPIDAQREKPSMLALMLTYICMIPGQEHLFYTLPSQILS